jgi:hypothetical protein
VARHETQPISFQSYPRKEKSTKYCINILKYYKDLSDCKLF